jgi:gluconolactonase
MIILMNVITKGHMTRDILKVVRSSYRLLPIAFLSVSLFAVEQLRPIEVTRFRSHAEGIVFDSSGYAYVSHGRFISRVALDGKKTIWAETGAPNGHKILPDGTHLVCDRSRRAVLHLDAQGKLIGPASVECDGKPLLEPNDLTIDPKGGFYFTDTGESHEAVGMIHFVDPQGKTHVAATGLHYPQGIVLRPDGKTLLVAESLSNRILSYEVLAPGRLGPMKVFADLPPKQSGQIDNQPDGMCLDQHGNLYIAHNGMRVVEVLSRKGRLIRQFPAGALTASDVAFGGPKMDQLFITGGLGAAQSDGVLFRFDLRNEKGLPMPPKRN